MFESPGPTTLWTKVIKPAGDPNSAEQRTALEQLLKIYDSLIRNHIALVFYPYGRNRRHSEEDLAQIFITRCLAGEQSFATADREKGSFRGWLKTVLKNFVIRQLRIAHAEPEQPGGAEYPDEPQSRHIDDELSRLFDEEWVRTVLARVRSRHRAEYDEIGNAHAYDLIFGSASGNRDDLKSMEELARALKTTVGAAKTRVSRFRDRFCELILDEVRNYVLDEDHLEEKMSHWFTPCWRRHNRSRGQP